MIPPHTLIELACQVTSSNPKQIMGKSRAAEHIVPKYVAIYLLKEYTHLHSYRIAEIFDLHETSINHAMSRVKSIRSGEFTKSHHFEIYKAIIRANEFIYKKINQNEKS